MNVYRCGIVLKKLNNKIKEKLKIVYIISGTDANEAYKKEEKKKVMEESIS